MIIEYILFLLKSCGFLVRNLVPILLSYLVSALFRAHCQSVSTALLTLLVTLSGQVDLSFGVDNPLSVGTVQRIS